MAKDTYSETKRQAEQLVRQSDVPFTMLRPPLMFGCFDVKHLGHILRLLQRTPVMPIPGSGRYLHWDVYGWQPSSAPARPKGGVGQGARALFHLLPGAAG